MGSAELTVAAIGVVGAILGAAIAIVAMVVVDRLQNRRLERDEIGRRRAGIMIDLLGSRSVLDGSCPSDSSEVSVFNTAMALVPISFVSEREVLIKFDAFQKAPSDERLPEFLQVAAKSAGADVGKAAVRDLYVVRPGVKHSA